MTLRTGAAREIITPARGISLVGYFTPRYNRGVLDNIYVKTVLFERSGMIGGIVSYDLCFLELELVRMLIARLKKEKLNFAENMIFCATHTHTGPGISNFLNVPMDRNYNRTLVEKTVLCVKAAYASLSESALSETRFKDNPFAFNRRYYMKQGPVVTNPGKCNPDIVKPEGPVDDEIGVLALTQDNRISTLIVNIVNHTDTIEGDFVSADWPGQMEKAIQNRLGYEVNVVTLVGCSGNINHFDVKSKRNQSSYAEAKKIGMGYAKKILAHLGTLKPISAPSFNIESASLPIRTRTLSPQDLGKAQALVDAGSCKANKNLTSEDLAKGEGAVLLFFAQQLIEFNRHEAGKTRTFPLVCLKFGNRLAITSLPGEPFTEIGMAIKKQSPFPTTFVVSLAGGEAGYIPLKACFGRGGYETLPIAGGGCHPDTAQSMITASLSLLAACRTLAKPKSDRRLNKK